MDARIPPHGPTAVKPLSGTKVLIGPSSFGEADPAPLDHLAALGCEVLGNPYKRKLTKAELLELLSDRVIGLVAGLEPLDREVLERSALKVISRCGSGLSNVDLQAAKDLGIAVYSTPSGPTDAVAELTVAAILNLLRLFPQMDKDLHDGRWTKRIGRQLADKTVVIVGFGRIGRRVASLLAPFRTRVVAVDPALTERRPDLLVMPLAEALPQADIVSFHCSGEQCLLGEAELALLKRGAFVLNASRGGIVSESALQRALDEGRVAGAWLDTFEREPYAGPLAAYPQVLLTPHAGSYTEETRRCMEAEAVQNLVGFFMKRTESAS
jgi:D-3-phosphoglycerate dehydrogenase / 2-oxoglutarate reductase